MKQKITSPVKRGFSVHLFLMTLLLTLSFSGMAQNRVNSAKSEKPVATKTKKKIQERIRSKVDFSVLDFKKGEIFGAFNPNQELVDKRDQFGKHFQNEDCTTAAILTAGGSLHFLDNGNWKAIDRQIIVNNAKRNPQHAYVNDKNSFLSFYPNYASSGIITEYKEGNVVEGTNKKMVWLDADHNPISQANINSSPAQISENKITYSNVFSGIDLVYYQQNDGRKMDYVINNDNLMNNAPAQAKYLAFAEDFSLPRGSSISEDKNEDGNIIALNVSVNGTIIFRYDMPKHYDSNNKEISSYYKIVQNTIYTIVSNEWLNSGLTFPVYIDPTLTVYPTAAGNYNTGCIDANAIKTANNDLYIGMRPSIANTGARRFVRAWASFNMASIPDGSNIDTVIFGCYIGLNTLDAAYGEMARVVPITSGIPNTATGGTLYNMCGENVPDALFSIGAGGTGNQSLNITSVVSSFVANSLTSNIFSLGFAPVGSFDTGFTEQVGIYGSTRPQQTSTGRPYLTVTYSSLTPCSGTPTGGITVLNNPLGATSSIIAASVSGDTSGVSGLMYQWESAPSASGPWTNISGATSATANITAANSNITTFYRRKITCSALSSYSTAVSYSTTCRPSYTEGNCAAPGDCRYIIISNVTLGSINNTTSTGSPAQGFAAPAYNNYSGTQSTSINDTTTYTLTATYADNGSPVNLGKIGLWVDWSGDGTFSGLNDFIGSSSALTNNGTATFTINVPAGATSGLRTLRVRSIFGDDTFVAADACSQLDYGETEDYAVNVTVSELVCATVSNLTATIGTPANGTNHALNVSWTGITGATNYDVQFSMDNGVNYNNVGTGNTTSTSIVFNAGEMPNHPFLFRVRAKNASQTCDWTFTGPRYTAADLPNLVLLTNPTGTSMQITLQAETPAANPAITTYSLFNETLDLYVQADGTLGTTEFFQTKATWGTKTVTGLTPETNYCFYAKAKNEDGDVRFTAAQTLAPTQKFDTNILYTGGSGSPDSSWFAPNSNPPFVFSTGGCDGGRVGYANNTTTVWSNFLRTPSYNLVGKTSVTLGFTMSNSYNAANTTGNSVYLNYYDTTYRSTNVTSIKIDGVPYTGTGTTGGKINFDIVRNCAYVEMTFDISSSTDLSTVFFYFNTNKSNVNDYSIYIDDYNIAGGDSFSSPDAVCLTTTEDCPLLVTSTTGASGCGSVLLNAEGNAGTTGFNWYDAATGGNLVATTLSGDYQTPVLGATTVYYVAAFNDDCESPRVAITATIAPTTAEIIDSTGASSCIPGSVTIFAETNNDGIYQVKWYSNEIGGTALHTGYSYTPNPIVLETTTFWAAAVDGDCESERTAITITLSSKTWNGSVDTNWNEAGNWSPAGVPNINNCVVIANTTNAPILLTGYAGYAKSLTLLESSSLVVQSESSLTVTEKVTIAEDITGATVANMTLMNNGYLLQTENAQNNINAGKITVHRNSTPMFRLEATAWSTPVQNQKLYDFAVGTYPGRIYEYNETTNLFDNSNISANSVFELGKGYSVRAPNTYNSVGGLKTTFEGEFYGKPNNGNIGIPITKNNAGNNYVGNPYPSPIDAAGLLSNNQDIDALYFWTHEAPPIAFPGGSGYSANNYATYNTAGGTVSAAGGEEPDGIIQVGQGFVAKTTAAVTLEFTNDLRINYSDGQFFRTALNPIERHRMWLNLSNSTSNFNQVLIGYLQNATMAKDHQIDAKMFDYIGSAIYSLLENDPYVIQGRSLPFDTADEVPLGFKAKEAGSFTISIDHVDGLFLEGQTIYIVDQLTNSIHNLSANAFTFVSEQGTFDSRFKIVYQDNLLGVSNPGITNNDWIVYKNDSQIKVQTTGFEIENISIYDLTGRLLLHEDNVQSTTFSCNANFAEQVLLVRVNKTLVKKVL